MKTVTNIMQTFQSQDQSDPKFLQALSESNIVTLQDAKELDQFLKRLPLQELSLDNPDISVKTHQEAVLASVLPIYLRLDRSLLNNFVPLSVLGVITHWLECFLSSDQPPEKLCLQLLTLCIRLQVFECRSFLKQAARKPLAPHSYDWAILFDEIQSFPELTLSLLEDFKHPLPPSIIGLSFLDFANQLGYQGKLPVHPFDTSQGIQRLDQWLQESYTTYPTKALSVASSLGHLKNPQRQYLLNKCLNHEDENVKCEAAWSAVLMGKEESLTLLKEFAINNCFQYRACEYLTRLGKPDLIPEEATSLQQQALGELIDWLTQPSEFGWPPDEVNIRSTINIEWPPTGREENLSIVEYRYQYSPFQDTDNLEQNPQPFHGVALIGSIPYSLYQHTSPEMKDEEVLAVHCCWEMKVLKKSKAPDTLSVEAGKRLLKETIQTVNQ
ncbi:Hypothetical protein PBC10988_5740 [Planctomycetales bacterium 10988]|nr:Hypothetical protein PBC10988_5740 [Planctomycetales bacterium 10988]